MHRTPVLGRSLGWAMLLALLLAPFAGFAGRAPAAAQGLVPDNWIKGFVMLGYGPDPYKLTNVPASLASLKATGANSVALGFSPLLLPHCHVKFGGSGVRSSPSQQRSWLRRRSECG